MLDEPESLLEEGLDGCEKRRSREIVIAHPLISNY
jgi:hypothetical protein